MKKFFLFISLTSVAFVSCKKDKDAEPEAPVTATTPTSGMPFTTGSYWIYEKINIDTNGVETSAGGALDSVYISNDSVINGKTYSVFVGSYVNPASLNFRRDSLGYIVDESGRIQYASTNFTDTLSTFTVPGYYDAYYMMNQPASPLTVPAGTFNVKDFRGTVTATYSGYTGTNPRYIHYYYSDGVGQVKQVQFFVNAQDYIGWRLVRYYIE